MAREEKQKESLREKLARRRKEIEERGKGKGNILYFKEGTTTRMRVLPVGEEKDWAVEATTFYLNEKLKGVISPATFGKPCPIMELYEDLKNSKKPADKELAKKLIPKKKYYVAVITYKDSAGKEIDEEKGVKVAQLTSGIYGEMIDAFLDPDWGDFTDPNEGYDFKVKRVGSGKMDTVYTCTPQKPTKLTGKYRKELVEIETLLKDSIPTYEELVDVLAEFQSDLGSSEEEEEEEDDRKAKRKDKKRKRDSE
jgi:hypothetical protein